MGKSSSKEVRVRGKFTKVTPSKHKKEKVFKHKLPVKKDIQTNYQLKDNEFRYYYPSSESLLDDYKEYIKSYCQKKDKTSDQYVLDVKVIWKETDPDFNLHHNEYKDEENLESKFFLPQKQLLLDNKDKPPEQQEAHIQASTIRLKLISLNRFFKILTEISIFIGLNTVEIGRLKGMISQCKANLKDLLREREQTIKHSKSKILLNANDMKAYGDSNHIVEVSKLFNELKDNPEEQFISIYNATNKRNYLMSVLALVNCPRASNLINITLDDVEKAKKDTTIYDEYVIKNKKYKVSIIYGAKNFLATNEIYEHRQLYIKHVRPRFISDTHRLNRNRYVFVSPRSDDKVASKPRTNDSINGCAMYNKII